MIIGFTGSRLGPRAMQTLAFRRFMAKMPVSRFVHGGCIGCDTIAHHHVRWLYPNICIEIHPCNLPVMQSAVVQVPMGNCEVHPELPPLERNRIIVSRIHGLIAIPKTDREEANSGTWATVRYAREIGCPVYVVKQDGRIVRNRGETL